MPTRHNEITASVWLQYTWHCRGGPNPVCWRSAAEWQEATKAQGHREAALEEQVRRAAPQLDPAIRALQEGFGVPRCVREVRAARPAPPSGTGPGWYEPRDMIALAMGAPEPRWMNGMWWHDRRRCPLAQVESASEIARLRAPDWANVECVQRMLDSRDRWRRECPGEPPAGFGILWDSLSVPGRGEVAALCYPSFVDLGVYLMGATRFLTVLAGEPELADAFMDLCFALSTSYTEFLLALEPAPFEGLCGFGGDATFFLSPALYQRYSAAWDARLLDHVRLRHGLPASAPCNLHSCGASSHLYGPWGNHPCRANITAVQTRLVPGRVGHLRASLPQTQLELTLHPPEFDLAGAEPAGIRAVLRTSAADADGRDVHFQFITAVHRPEDLPRLARNVQAVLEEMEGLRS